jgi:hypothetical protein
MEKIKDFLDTWVGGILYLVIVVPMVFFVLYGHKRRKYKK